MGKRRWTVSFISATAGPMDGRACAQAHESNESDRNNDKDKALLCSAAHFCISAKALGRPLKTSHQGTPRAAA
jgi:hypothetical protein